MPGEPTDHRRAVADRNVTAILDAAEELLGRGDATSTAAVASAAGVSRPTVYAHFPTRTALLEAVVERAVAHASEHIAAADLGTGPADEALDRLVGVAWDVIDNVPAVVHAAASELTAESMARTHQALRGPIGALIERGQQAGEVRADLPAQWLTSAYFALVHACRDDVHAGRLDAAKAPDVLRTSLRALTGI